MSENESPPTMHILRPHHLDLLTVFVLVFREFELRPLPQLFLLHLYRLLLNEVSEARIPESSQHSFKPNSGCSTKDADSAP